jgi:hypothetical protein
MKIRQIRRNKMSVDEFVGYFERAKRIEAREVFLFLRRSACVKEFSVLPDDDLSQVYWLCDEELDDAIIELANKCQKVNPMEIPPQLIKQSACKTVRDLVDLIAGFPGKTFGPVREQCGCNIGGIRARWHWLRQ